MGLYALPLNLAENGQTLYSINKEMKDVLKYLLKNVSKNDARPILQCIHVTKNVFETTNGFTIVRIVFKKEQSFFPEGDFQMKLLGEDKLLIENYTSIKNFPDTTAVFKHEEIEKHGMYYGENIVEGSKGFAKIAFSANLMKDVLSMKNINIVRFYLSNLILMQIATNPDCEYDIYVCMMPMHPGEDYSNKWAEKNNGASFRVTDLPEKKEEEKSE